MLNHLIFEVVMIVMSFIPLSIEAQVTQTIRGQISDIASGEPMIGVTIQVGDSKTLGTVSDTNGIFIINNVPVGRHTIRASYVGYEPVVLKEQLLLSSKELVLDLRMRESVTTLGEVIVKPHINKQMPLNEMAQVGARMFSVEEANRFAGAVADPARTASMYAGVATGGATNGISIHGNSPHMLQWRVEGVEVNNPNHFADIIKAGGGIITSLNGSVLANSDFLTGAMPAEYGNALSGAFDMNMRVGNNSKHEHAIQVGTLGVDLASEGPLGKKSKASYLVNYRYSFIGIAKKLHAINTEKQSLDYQDLSFKLNFPTTGAGTFSIWFTGLIDNYENNSPDISKWETLVDSRDSKSRQRSFAGGLTHSYRFSSVGTLISRIAYTRVNTHGQVNDYDNQLHMTPTMDGHNDMSNLIVNVQYQHKFSSLYTMQNGIEHQYMDLKGSLDYVHQVGSPLYRAIDSEGNTSLSRAYTSHKFALSNRLSAVAGVNVMWFNLNNQWLIEPRVSMQYNTSPSSSFSVAYALNSRKEATDTYFVMRGQDFPNKHLGLTRSHYISASFAKRLGEDAMLKIEPYWQHVFDVPVEEGTTYSTINHDFFVQNKVLVNKGAGRNYGLDLTLEHYLKNGFYDMLTGTIFRSKYRDAQGEWHNTRHDRGYITNILGGKEWMVGKSDKNVFGINARLTLMGGDRYTPAAKETTYEIVAKLPDKNVPEDGNAPFSKQLGMNVGYAFSLKYTLNSRQMTHHFILEYLKTRSFYGQTYDIHTHEIVNQFTSLTFPNIAYRIEF